MEIGDILSELTQNRGYVHPRQVEGGLAMTEETALARAKTQCGGRIDDVVKEMHWWACFQPGESSHTRPRLEFQPPAGRQGPEAVARLEPKIGRNAPCPCRSGSKHKKCCGK